MDVAAFRAKLGAGGARPNQFQVVLTWPQLVGGSGTGDDSLLVNAASLPPSVVNPTITQFRGREVKTAGERIFDPWNITILNDTTMKLRKLFERWSDLMNERVNNGGSTVPATYMSDLEVHQMDRNDAIIRSYIIYNAFPINVSDVALGYGINDTISEFQVTFAISHWSVDPV
jgi:hypothetical protein